MCCTVLECVALCHYIVPEYVTLCWNVLHCVRQNVLHCVRMCYTELEYVNVCCAVLSDPLPVLLVQFSQQGQVRRVGGVW